jgi:ATP/ADP translocase
MAKSKAALPEMLNLPAAVTKDLNLKEIDLAAIIDKVEIENSLLLKFLIIVIILEHMIVILKFSIEKYIPDTPYWVDRCLASVQHTKEKMEIEHAASIT